MHFYHKAVCRFCQPFLCFFSGIIRKNVCGISKCNVINNKNTDKLTTLSAFSNRLYIHWLSRKNILPNLNKLYCGMQRAKLNILFAFIWVFSDSTPSGRAYLCVLDDLPPKEWRHILSHIRISIFNNCIVKSKIFL